MARIISPIILLAIVILALAFFALGLIQLLIRCLMKSPSFSLNSHSSRFQGSSNYSQAFQSQLQNLFRLHDSGLDRALIDALPVFYYKDIVGSKDLFDCAVCLCEFTADDKLKCLPTCSHAFHIQCIETWLLSNSTCPLCRSLIGNTVDSPLSSFGDSMRQWDLSCPEGANGPVTQERVFSVRLGNFKNSNGRVSTGGSSSIDARRCYSMGAFQYIVEDANLQVSLSSRNSTGAGAKVEALSTMEPCNNITEMEGKKINPRSKGDSFSVSKIWLWSKKGKFLGDSDDANDKVAVLPVPHRSDLV